MRGGFGIGQQWVPELGCPARGDDGARRGADEGRRSMSARVAMIAAALVVGTVGLAALVAAVLLAPLDETQREDFDPTRGREALPSPESEPSGEPAPPARADEEGPYRFAEAFESFLVLGSDAQDGFAGARADVIIVGLLPADDPAPILFSIPRDLWVPDRCRGGMTRINAGLNGCGSHTSGPELTAIMVEDLTGIPIDHYAKVDFEGFTEVIDALGGVEICNDHPVRDEKAELDLPAGCLDADGEDALAWVRSRRTLRLVDGTWRMKPGVSDLSRNERQQEVVLQALERLSSFRSVGQVRALGRGIAGSITVSETLSATDLARIAWSLRDLEREDVQRLRIPVEPHVTSAGAQVLASVEPFEETFVREVPEGAELLAGR